MTGSAGEQVTDRAAADQVTDRAADQVVDRAATGPTGHPVVDAAVAGLAGQADLPPGEQVAGYEAAQRALHQTLASIDQT